MLQFSHGRSNIGAYTSADHGFVVNVTVILQDGLQSRANTINNGTQVRRAVRVLERHFLQCRDDGSAIAVSQDDDQPGIELLCRVLDAADLGRRDDVSGNPDNKQVTNAAIEDEFRRHA